jgi:hypothetical protein
MQTLCSSCHCLSTHFFQLILSFENAPCLSQRFVPLSAEFVYNADVKKIYTLSSEIRLSVRTQHQIRLSQSMTGQQIPEQRTAPKSSSAINSLIATANKNDRFKLLEDDVPAANLENHIHPIFWWFNCDGPFKQMLRLASQFLTHDSVLIFFVPLLYGRKLKSTNGGMTKTYLSDPLVFACGIKRKELLDGVRQALRCLAHSVEFRFMKPEKRVYARTLISKAGPVHTSECGPIFQCNLTAVIEIADRFMHFYYDENGYKASSRCAQFRHDFLFASTLIHEIVHAVGVLRRGNLIEPYIHTDHPDTEWGYAWEHFIFGCVINPQDQTPPGTHLLMQKIWADPTSAEEAGGKEYCDVPISYIAQWFREETWDIIAERGPIAILPPTTHFKIQSSRKFGAWIVSTDCLDIKQDIIALCRQWNQQCRKLDANSLPVSASARIFWRRQTTKALQRSNVPAPLRVSWLSTNNQTHIQEPFAGKVSCASTSTSAQKSQTIDLTTSTKITCGVRKRQADSDNEIIRVSKTTRR